MLTNMFKTGLSRRRMLRGIAALAGTATASSLMIRGARAAEQTVKIGFLAPLTGEVAAWGKPGLDGCLIWAEWINAAGGVNIGGEAHMIEFVAYDDEYDAGKARAGATQLIKEDGVKLIMMLGGDPTPAGRAAGTSDCPRSGRDLPPRPRGRCERPTR